jgi:hypothetical protein
MIDVLPIEEFLNTEFEYRIFKPIEITIRTELR